MLTSDELSVLPEVLREYDWQEAFHYAPFPITDVAEVLHSVEGANDADSWVAVVRLKSGVFGYVKAWCDYTGWDCQAGGHGETRATLAEIVREVCEEDDRKRLGLSLTETP